VRMDENLIRRVLGLASLSTITAGYAGRSEDVQETSLLLPVGRRSAALALAAEVLGVPPHHLSRELEPAPGRAAVPRLSMALLAGLIAGAVALLAFEAPGAFGFLVIPGGALLAVAAWRSLGHGIDQGLAAVRSGAVVRRTTFIPTINLQHLVLTRGPLQRALGLATVRLAIPRGSPRAEDLDSRRADERFGELVDRLVTPMERPS
jgi:putative membrane protein